MNTKTQLAECRLQEKLLNLGYQNFNSNQIKEIIAHSEVITYNKKEIFADEMIDEYIHLVIKGAFRYYIKDTSNKDRVLRFSFKHDILFSFGVASCNLNIQATRESTILKIKVANLFPDIIERSNFLVKLEKRAICKIENELMLSKLSFEQRFKKIEEDYNDFVALVSTNDLASYLNVSPQTICKTRASFPIIRESY